MSDYTESFELLKRAVAQMKEDNNRMKEYLVIIKDIAHTGHSETHWKDVIEAVDSALGKNFDAIEGSVAALKIENARYRDSLEIISNGTHNHRGCDPCDFDCPVAEARSALENTK